MKFPLLTLLVCGSATILFFYPKLSEIAIYDRTLIIQGQWWRIITGNLVHLSTQHFEFNILATFIISLIAEIRKTRYLATLYIASAITISLTIFSLHSELRYYGGLSGIVTAILVYVCLSSLHEKNIWAYLCYTTLILITIKISIEFIYNTSIVSPTMYVTFTPVPISHLMGAITAVTLFITDKIANYCVYTLRSKP